MSTLERGQKVLEELLAKALAVPSGEGAAAPALAGRDAFLLYDTYGFPLELTQELAELRGVQVGCRGWARELWEVHCAVAGVGRLGGVG